MVTGCCCSSININIKVKNSIYLPGDASVVLVVVGVAVVDVLTVVSIVEGCIVVDEDNEEVTGVDFFGSVVVCNSVEFR